jgi:hypothetical protein
MLLHGLYCLEMHIGENFMIPHFYFCDVYCPYLLLAYYVYFPLFLHCPQPLHDYLSILIDLKIIM